MSHVPNITLRETVGLGGIGTLGRSDLASPDTSLWSPRPRRSLDRCTADGFQLGWLTAPRSADAAWQSIMDSLTPHHPAAALPVYRLPTPSGTPAKITQQDFIDAAAVLKCEVAAVKAVAEVEARGSGFLGDGRPKILFEAHQFSKYTRHLFDTLYPHISSPQWKNDLYLGGAREYDRLDDALRLDSRAAIMSTSWGAFQIMGFNHAAAGFGTPEEFVEAMYKGEGEHLKAFISFIQANKLAKYIQDRNWEAFAKAYNGSGYKANNYDGKLAKAYAKHAGGATGPGKKLP